MKKYLLISGSPRPGNTEYVLRKIYTDLIGKKELLLLRKMKINHCLGCFKCEKSFSCVQNDSMTKIIKRIMAADILIFGAPRYYDNINGLSKNFIDRLLPLDWQAALKGKKIFMIMTGGGSIKGSEKYLKQAMSGFIKYLELKLIGVAAFKAMDANELKNNKNTDRKIKMIIKKLNQT
ncbi:flavodoxin family protein [Candidatus Kuenenbacteria bacterium]|nr:flavodoxin family protein [Candidatus Kuenenbacteria bacterium]